MTNADIAAVQAVASAAGAMFRSVSEPRIAACADHPPMSESTLAEFIEGGRAWVVTGDDGGGENVAGFLVARVVDGSAHVEEVAVDPAHGRRGYASALLDEVASWARAHGLPSVTLTTFRDVPWNRPFYERRGYRVLAGDELTDTLHDLVIEEDEQYGLPQELRVVMRMSTPGGGGCGQAHLAESS